VPDQLLLVLLVRTRLRVLPRNVLPVRNLLLVRERLNAPERPTSLADSGPAASGSGCSGGLFVSSREGSEIFDAELGVRVLPGLLVLQLDHTRLVVLPLALETLGQTEQRTAAAWILV